jgi:hypothetical protein
MAPQDILEALRTLPFAPMRICMTDGQTFDLFHREMCMVGHTWLLVGVPRKPTDLLYHRTVTLDPHNIVRLEPLAACSPSPKNGPQS